MARTLQQVAVLLRKNYLLKRRKPISTLCEFLLPLIIAAMSAAICVFFLQNFSKTSDITVTPTSLGSIRSSLAFSACQLLPSASKVQTAWCELAITPDTPKTREFGDQLLQTLLQWETAANSADDDDGEVNMPLLDVLYFAHESDIEAVFTNTSIYAAIVMDTETYGNYTIRMDASLLPPKEAPAEISIFSSFSSTLQSSKQYITSGFALLQSAVDNTIIRSLTAHNDNGFDYELLAAKNPRRSSGLSAMFMGMMGLMLPSFYLMGYLPVLGLPMLALVNEKSNRMRETLKIMGMKEASYWISWLITLLLPNILAALFMCIALIAVGVITINVIASLGLFITFSLSILTFCLLGSAVTSSSKGVLFLTALWLYIISQIVFLVQMLPLSFRYVSCLIAPVAFSIGVSSLLQEELFATGSVDSLPSISTTTTVGFLALDTLLYLVLAWYFNNVMTGTYGVPKPFYFIFQRSYWFPKRYTNAAAAEGINQWKELESETTHSNRMSVEESVDESRLGEPIVDIRGLTKIYEQAHGKALDNMNLKLYSNQIFALLGHNGAGKSTTISLLTGLYAPTAGDALISGYRISTDMDTVRDYISVCPQTDNFYDTLTAYEHMMLYAGLRGMDAAAAEAQIASLLSEIGLALSDAKTKTASALSGGMKRKISLAIALLGDSRVLFLDEPSSGLDPLSRRFVWDLLKRKKAGRTIVLTTHFMEEADFLGDRIAIMAQGQIRCCGSSLYLKNRFGIGYYLTLSKALPGAGSDTNSNSSSSGSSSAAATRYNSAVLEFIGRHIGSADAVLHADNLTELVVLLPMHTLPHFPKLFAALEQKETLASLKIRSYGLSMTTLEEVFLKISDNEHNNNSLINSNNSLINSNNSSNSNNSNNSNSNGQISIDIQQQQQQQWKKEQSQSESRLSLLAETETNEEQSYLLNHKKRTASGRLMDQLRLLIWKRLLQHKQNKWQLLLYFLIPMTMLLLSVGTVQVALRSINLGAASLQPFTFAMSDLDPITIPYTAKSANVDLFLNQIPTRKLPDDSLSPLFQQFATNDSLANAIHRNEIPNGRFGALVFDDIQLEAEKEPLSEQRFALQIWYTETIFSTLPTFINTASNAIASLLLVDDQQQQQQQQLLSVNSKPFEPRDSSQWDMIMKMVMSQISVGLTLFFSLSISSFRFASNIVNEKHRKLQWQLSVFGVHPFGYWLANFIVDFATHIALSVFSIGILAILQSPLVTSVPQLFSLMLINVLYSCALVLFIYCATLKINNPDSVTRNIIALIVATAMVPYIANTLVQAATMSAQQDGTEPNKFIEAIGTAFYSLFPTATFSAAVSDLEAVIGSHSVFDTEVQWEDIYRWESNFPLRIIMLLSHIAIMIAVLVIAQLRSGRLSRRGISSEQRNEWNNAYANLRIGAVQEDSDVAAERQRVLSELQTHFNNDSYNAIGESSSRGDKQASGDSGANAAMCSDLWKMYDNKTLAAVGGVSFGIRRHQCFGLLGPNGAGKTSTISMLMLDSAPSNGDIFYNNESIFAYRNPTTNKEVNSVFELYRDFTRLSCCLQSDSLWDELTGRQHLQLFAQLRNPNGLSRTAIDAIVNSAIRTFDLEKYADRSTKTYSGGNKRKLCVALAMLPGADVVYLDEPSTGMDPSTRRSLWKAIKRSTETQNQSIVLTTHSMEEADAVCHTVGIMVAGRMQCIGSTQHLKSKFGSGYRLFIKLQSDYEQQQQQQQQQLLIDAVVRFVSATVGEGYYSLLEIVSGLGIQLTFELHNTISLAKLFAQLEAQRNSLYISDYAVTQTSLEQVFLYFARKQDIVNMALQQ